VEVLPTTLGMGWVLRQSQDGRTPAPERYHGGDVRVAFNPAISEPSIEWASPQQPSVVSSTLAGAGVSAALDDAR
jgi:hypothetical protein